MANKFPLLSGLLQGNLDAAGYSIEDLSGLTLGNTSTGVKLFNTADEVTNYELGEVAWKSNVFTLQVSKGGTGTGRTFKVQTVNDASTGTPDLITLAPEVAQSGTAGYTALALDITETSTGSGTVNLITAARGGNDYFVLGSTGNLALGHSGSLTTRTLTMESGNTTVGDIIGQITFIGQGGAAARNYSRIQSSIVNNGGGGAYVGSLELQVSISGVGLTTYLLLDGSGYTTLPQGQELHFYENGDASSSDYSRARLHFASSAFNITTEAIGGAWGPTINFVCGPILAPAQVIDCVTVLPTVNQSGTGGYRALLIDVTETATGSGIKNLFSAGRGGSSYFDIDRSGNVSIAGTVTQTSASGYNLLPLDTGIGAGFTGAPDQTLHVKGIGFFETTLYVGDDYAPLVATGANFGTFYAPTAAGYTNNFQVEPNPASGGGSVHAFYVENITAAGNTQTFTLYGQSIAVLHANASNMTAVYGLFVDAVCAGGPSYTTPTVKGVDVGAATDSNGTDLIGVRIALQQLHASATLTNLTALQIEASTVLGTVTNRYAIKQLGSTDCNLFTGPVTIGTGAGTAYQFQSKKTFSDLTWQASGHQFEMSVGVTASNSWPANNLRVLSTYDDTFNLTADITAWDGYINAGLGNGKSQLVITGPFCTVTSIFGFASQALIRAGATVTHTAGFVSLPVTADSGVAVVGSGYGFFAKSPYSAGGLSMTNYFAFYAQSATGAANLWSFYSPGSTLKMHQAGYLGLAQQTAPAYPLDMLDGPTATTATYGIYCIVQPAPSATQTGGNRGMFVQVDTINSSQLHASVSGAGYQAVVRSAGGTTALYGIETVARKTTGSGTVAAAYGLWTRVQNDGGASAITEGYGLMVNGVGTKTGNITTYYGVRVGAPTGAGTITSNYAFYSDDAAAHNVFLGVCGFGVIAATTSFAVFGAATTSLSSMRITAGTAPSSPVEGDIWLDSTQKCLKAFFDGVIQFMVGNLFTQTASQTIVSTVTETTLFGSGTGTLTLPANFWTVGKTVRITIRGTLGNTGTPTAQIRVKTQGVTVLDTTAVAMVSVTAPESFTINVLLTCRTTGATGTVTGSGLILHHGGTAFATVLGMDIPTATGTVNTTTSGTLDVTWQWGTSSASNTITSANSTVEVLN